MTQLYLIQTEVYKLRIGDLMADEKGQLLGRVNSTYVVENNDNLTQIILDDGSYLTLPVKDYPVFIVGLA